MVAQISKPGVEITQVFTGTTPTPSIPTLIPCIVGPAYEVVDLLAADGTPSSTSLVENQAGAVPYQQLPLSIEAKDFPTPRADPNQMTVLSEEVTVGVSVAGALDELPTSPGTAFLCDLNVGQRPGIHFPIPTAILAHTTIGDVKFEAVAQGVAGNGITIITVDAGAGGAASASYDNAINTVTISVDFSAATCQDVVDVVTNTAAVAAVITADTSAGGNAFNTAATQVTAGGTSTGITQGTLIIAIDNVTRQSVAADKYVETYNDMDAATLAIEINRAVNETVAEVKTIDGVPGLLISSNRFGAGGSITLRKASGNFTSTFVKDLTGLDSTIRVEGAGLVAVENTVQGITTSSWLEFSQGAVFNDDLVNRVSSAAIAELETIQGIRVVQIDSLEVITLHEAADIVFKDDLLIKAATPTSNGDLIYASGPFGQSISAVMVTAVEASKIKLGVVDTLRSEYDAAGNPTAQRYIDFSLGELTSNPTPFAPKNGFVIAQNLTTWTSYNDIEIGTIGPAQVVTEDLAGVFTAATAATVSYDGVTDAAITASVGLTIVITLVDDGVTTVTNFLVEASHDASNLQLALNTALTGVTATLNNGNLTFESVLKKKEVFVRVASGATGDVALLASSTAGSLVNGGYEDTGSDELMSADLIGKTLTFTFNNSRRTYAVIATGQSVSDFINDVNTFVGTPVLSRLSTYNNVAGAYLQLRSPLIGIASHVAVDITTADDIGEALFANATSSAGAGRPNADVSVTDAGTVRLSPEILRNPTSGIPLNNATVTGNIHIGYRALRLDLTASANQPGLIKISNTDDLNTIYGPISSRNPLALALYYALINAGAGTEVTALGVDDVSEAEPEGTTISYNEALEYLRTFEVYTLCPLSSSEDVIQLFNTHVTDMSTPEQRAERVFIASPRNPTRRNDEVILSSGAVGAESTGNAGQIDLGTSPEALLAAQGIDTSADIPFELINNKQLYIHITIGDDSYKYSVQSVDGGRVTVRYTYTTAQNADNFYSTEELPNDFSNATFSLALRGTVLTLPGSTRLDKSAYAETVRDKAQQYANRRQFRLHPDTVQSSAIGGVNQSLPSYYYGAAIAGAVAFIEAQEPFTRVPFVGFNDVTGPALERSHLDTLSAGNAHIEINTTGELPSLRIQSTTDPSKIESREFSVTKAVDSFAKSCRAQLKQRIGKFNITQSYIDDLTILVDSLCTTATNNGLFRGASVTKLEQDKTQPDTILVEVQLEVLYPANYIKLTLVV